MSSADEMIQKFSLKESKFIKTLCDPLQRLGIKFYFYSCTTEENGFFSIGNMPEVLEYYYANKIYMNSPFFHHPSLIKPGIYDYRCVRDSRLQEGLKSCERILGVSIGLCIVEKRKNKLLRFGYCTDPLHGQECMSNIINALAVLKEFNIEFCSKVQHIIKFHSSYMLNLPSELGDSYNQLPKGLINIPSYRDKAQILDSTGSIDLEDATRLSHQEKACLGNLLTGDSYRNIGDALKIKTKSVESIIDRTKFKLKLNTKSELISYAQKLDKCGFFEED